MTVVIGVESSGVVEERVALSSDRLLALPCLVLALSLGISAVIALCSQLQYPTKMVTLLVEEGHKGLLSYRG